MSNRMRHPSISVVIPHLNDPNGLKRCLTSLLAQDFDTRRIEIIVVDNGSSSLPVEICSGFQGVVLEQENKPGPGRARNKGVSVAEAPLIAFMDADCVADRNWLATIETAFADETLEVAGGQVRIAMADPSRPTMLEAYESVFSYRQKHYIEKLGFSCGGNLAMRRSVYDRVGPFAGIELSEDRDWGQRATAMGSRVRFVPEMTVYHPPCRTLDDLYRRWDRHVSHDFARRSRGWVGRASWVLRAVAILFSPIFEISRILPSAQLSTWRERSLVSVAITIIRVHRAQRMFEQVFNPGHAVTSLDWNRAIGSQMPAAPSEKEPALGWRRLWGGH